MVRKVIKAGVITDKFATIWVPTVANICQRVVKSNLCYSDSRKIWCPCSTKSHRIRCHWAWRKLRSARYDTSARENASIIRESSDSWLIKSSNWRLAKSLLSLWKLLKSVVLIDIVDTSKCIFENCVSKYCFLTQQRALSPGIRLFTQSVGHWACHSYIFNCDWRWKEARINCFNIPDFIHSYRPDSGRWWSSNDCCTNRFHLLLVGSMAQQSHQRKDK